MTPDWNEDQVNYVIKNLKKKKSQDPHGYPNELIQCGGKDVTISIMRLLNGIKKNRYFLIVCEHVIQLASTQNKGSTKRFQHV